MVGEMDINELREEIDKVDREIVELFSKRMRICEDIGKYKIEKGLQVLDVSREVDKLQAVRDIVDEGLEDEVEELFKTLMTLSRRRQQILIDESEGK